MLREDPLEHEQDPPEATSPGAGSAELFAERYAIVQAIGTGGMGKVFEARDTRVGRAVALKLMRAHAQDRATLVQRFHREYRAMARIDHPGVPRVLDADTDKSGRPYYTMELVRGEPLIDRAGELSPRVRLRLIRELAQILESVHKAGVVHRDIKPSNILLDAENRPYLVDFGACSLLDEQSSEREECPAAQVNTAPGTWLGTLGYIDPAVLEGAASTVRSDIYSLSATLSWMFTQQHPSSDAAAPLPCTGVEVVDAILRSGMARDPDRRPAAAADLVARLVAAEATLDLRPPPGTELGETRRATLGLSPALVLALGALGGALAGPVRGAAFHDDVAPPSAPVRAIDSDDPAVSKWMRESPTFAPPEVPDSPALPTLASAIETPSEPPSLVSEEQPVPESPRTSPARTKRREKRTKPSDAHIADWDHVRHTIQLGRCFRDEEEPPTSVRVLMRVEGHAGKLENIRPAYPNDSVKRCLIGSLERVRFAPFEGRFDGAFEFSVAEKGANR